MDPGDDRDSPRRCHVQNCDNVGTVWLVSSVAPEIPISPAACAEHIASLVLLAEAEYGGL